jgi:hypothetical protein
MKSLVARCRLCGNDNLFPVKYAGRTLSCSHCGESLPVSAADAAPVVAVTAPVGAEPASRETGLRRLMKALCFALCLLCFVFLGAIGGAWGGLLLAVKFGLIAYVLVFITCPVGGLIGLFLTKWLGQGIARLMSSYRLTFPGLLLGMGGGVFYWTQKFQASPDRLLAGQLVWDEWLLLSVAAAIGGLLLGLVFMILDALVNFTR